jgi:hypothetical protein
MRDDRHGEIVHCKTGISYCAGGMEHRFINFNNGFTTWVIFYGTEGGEAGPG